MSTPSPRVSIGLPVYNGERYLESTLDSLLAQTFPDFELIISDNASTDRTAAICAAYQARDPRVRYSRNAANLGATRNYNLTVEQARGEYFKWAAYDDPCGPEFLERCVRALDANPAVVLAYTRARVIDEAGQDLGYDPVDLDLRQPRPVERYAAYHRRFRQHRNCNPVFGVIRTATLRRTAMIGNYVASDEVLLGELALHGQFYEVPDELFFRRDHPNTSTRAFLIKNRAAWFDPALGGRLHLPVWIWFQQQAAALGRAPLRLGERGRCWRELLITAGLPRHRSALYNESILWAKQQLRPLPAPVKAGIKAGLRALRHLATAVVGVVRPGKSGPPRKSF